LATPYRQFRGWQPCTLRPKHIRLSMGLSSLASTPTERSRYIRYGRPSQLESDCSLLGDSPMAESCHSLGLRRSVRVRRTQHAVQSGGLARPTVAASLVDGGFECYGLIATVSTWASVTGLSLQEPERVELRFERAMCLLEIEGLQRHVRISIACRCHSDVEFVAFPLVKS